jgi:hypothetical protein
MFKITDLVRLFIDDKKIVLAAGCAIIYRKLICRWRISKIVPDQKYCTFLYFQ